MLAKLWSVMPRLFAWPPARSLAQVLERVSLLMLVGGILFEIVTGVLNIQYDYIFGFSFYTAHYYGAWVFIAGFVIHVAIKLPTHVRRPAVAVAARACCAPSRPTPEPSRSTSPTAWSPPDPARRRSAGAARSALVGGGALLVAVLTAGPDARRRAPATPRCCCRAGAVRGDGPNDFQVNRTAAAAGITAARPAERWRLTLTGGPHPVVLDRAALLAMPQHTADLPIACVEGWSTTQTWTGVRLRDLARWPACRTGLGAACPRWNAPAPFSRATLQAQPGAAPGRAAGAARQRRPTCRPTTASPRGSSCPRCPACTTPNGSPPSTFRTAAGMT